MKNLPLILLLIFFSGHTVQSQTFYKGGDLSYVKELEGCGVQWKENNTDKDILSIFKDNGANIVRFRIWHTPTTGNNGYTDTESMISRAKAKGLKVILDFHYSDTWADAGKQKCPAAWISVVNNNSVLSDSLYNYTKKTLQTLKDKGLMPEFVQVGNETNGGMCFPGDGTVTWPTEWAKQTLLFNAGIRAVRDVDVSTKIILHVADPNNAEWWAGQLNSNGVTGYDILGVSFYPIWHTNKTINDFGTIITNIRNTYQKDVMVVETGLPWTNSWDDNTTNVMNGVPAAYGSTPSPEIQAQWLTDLSNKMVATRGIGIVYWEPDWVASNVTACPAEFGGSSWENVALFDFSNNLMTNGGIKFCQLTTGINLPTAKSDNLSLSVFPNPENDELNVQFNAKSAAKALLEIYDVQGRIIKAFAEKPVIGSNKFTLNISELRNGSGIFVLRLIQNEVSYNQSFILNR
ncbi:MAG TPA: glycosyl hydrolase 53 family protein [Bacteroidales bacterium]|jgi:arabinogalactan endo-1,4-beta-galactosidase